MHMHKVNLIKKEKGNLSNFNEDLLVIAQKSSSYIDAFDSRIFIPNCDILDAKPIFQIQFRPIFYCRCQNDRVENMHGINPEEEMSV